MAAFETYAHNYRFMKLTREDGILHAAPCTPMAGLYVGGWMRKPSARRRLRTSALIAKTGW